MNGDNKPSHYHVELKLPIGGVEARLNCFADDLDTIFSDIGAILALAPTLSPHAPTSPPPAKPAQPSAPAPTPAAPKQAPPQQQPPAGRPAPPPGSPQPSARTSPRPPVCPQCGSSADMELIKFTSKKTGEERQAWKCQACNEWHWPNGKPARQ